MELEKVKAYEAIELEKEKVRLTRITEESRIMLADTILMNEDHNNWFINKNEINERNNGGD